MISAALTGLKLESGFAAVEWMTIAGAGALAVACKCFQSSMRNEQRSRQLNDLTCHAVLEATSEYILYARVIVRHFYKNLLMISSTQ